MTETTIPDLMRHAASTYGAREFLRFPDTSLSFAEADERSGRMAGALIDQGVRPGDRVAIMMDNVPGWPLSWLAVLKAGAVTVPVNVRYRAADLEHVLRDSGAVATITTGEHAPHVPGAVHLLDALRDGTPRPPRQADPDDVANFQYTSGTTGFPKACMLTHDYWLRTARIAAGQVELRDDDVMMIAQAYSYMDPQWVTLLCLMGGIPLVVLPASPPPGSGPRPGSTARRSRTCWAPCPSCCTSSRPTRTTATTACAWCSARASSPACTPRSRSAGERRGASCTAPRRAAPT
ncbi:AMP-binding protein [Nonomuraea thailandensis]